MARWRSGIATTVVLLAVGFSAFHWFSAYYGQPPAYAFRSIHLSLVLVMVYLQDMLKRPAAAWLLRAADGLCALFVLATQVFYILAAGDAFYFKEGKLTPTDVAIGTIYLLLTLEATRRWVGMPLVAVVLFFLGNALFADRLFWVFYGPPVSWMYLIEQLFFSDQGLFTVPIGAMVSYIVLFIIFGAVLFQTGARRTFTDLAFALVGKSIGGAAKAAIFSSALLGTVSGSAVANVVTTGSVTIPLMKRLGYDRDFAGGVEAVASSGGQIMPPVMGATAFIMAEFLQVPYQDVMIAALLPAVVYYMSLWWMVDFEARRLGLQPVPTNQIPALGHVLRQGGNLVLAVAALIVMLIFGISVSRAGAIIIAVTIALSFLRRGTRINGRELLDALEEAARICLPISLACASAGVIIGTAFLSGTATRLTSSLVSVGGGNLITVLVLTMLASFILGMGLTTSADYVLLVALAIPAAVALGVSPMAGHMFAFYFSSISGITPPVALASFAAAGIAGGSFWRTGIMACKVGLAAFLVPYMFVFREGLLLRGTPWEIAEAFLATILGMIAMAGAVQNWFFGRPPLWQRALLFAAALALIAPGAVADLIGVVLVGAVALLRWRLHAPARAVAAAPAAAGRSAATVVIDEAPRDVAFTFGYLLSWLPLAAFLAVLHLSASRSWHRREFNLFLIGFAVAISLVTIYLYRTYPGRAQPGAPAQDAVAG